jgi:DHA2 family multidrug resistance protein
MWMTSRISPDTSYGVFVSMRIMQVIGLPFLFVPISTLAFKDVPKEKSSNASAVFAMSRNLGGSIGIAILTSYLARHQQIHQANLTAKLTPANVGYSDALVQITAKIASHGQTAAAADHFSLGHIYQQLLHQSGLLAFNDSFALMALVMGTLAIVTFIMPYNNPHAKKSAAAAAAH